MLINQSVVIVFQRFLQRNPFQKLKLKSLFSRWTGLFIAIEKIITLIALSCLYVMELL